MPATLLIAFLKVEAMRCELLQDIKYFWTDSFGVVEMKDRIKAINPWRRTDEVTVRMRGKGGNRRVEVCVCFERWWIMYSWGICDSLAALLFQSRFGRPARRNQDWEREEVSKCSREPVRWRRESLRKRDHGGWELTSLKGTLGKGEV